MKLIDIYEQIINEINMSPNSLRSLVKNIDARAGMEFEMIVPIEGAVSDDDDLEPDYDEDQRSRSFSDIEAFFNDGEFNSTETVRDVVSALYDDFIEWSDEQAFDEWAHVMHDQVLDYANNNTSDEDVRQALDLDEDHELTREDWAEYANYCVENQTSEYDYAQEEFLDDYRSNANESSWLSRNYPYMSDISERHQDIVWPHWTSSSEGEANLEQLADQFGSMIGRKVNYSRNYHGGKREADTYVIEPDGSLRPDGDLESGLEFVSPPLPLADMLSDLDKIVKWAKQYGAYTNKSTGLHMNVSVPGVSTEKIDYVKLALLLGDEYVLSTFGRLGSDYCKSAMKIVRDRVRDRPEDAEAMLRQMKQHLSDMATKVIHSGETHKYTSINTKGGYVEFRSPGGDWMSEYADNPGKVTNTLLRFVVALDAAIDPEKYRQEYLKKLYKLLDIKKETDTLGYFAKFAAGELPQSALKSFVKQAQLERNLKKGNVGGEMFWWRVNRPGSPASIEVVAKSKEEAIEIATKPENYPEWATSANLEAKPLRPYNA